MYKKAQLCKLYNDNEQVLVIEISSIQDNETDVRDVIPAFKNYSIEYIEENDLTTDKSIHSDMRTQQENLFTEIDNHIYKNLIVVNFVSHEITEYTSRKDIQQMLSSYFESFVNGYLASYEEFFGIGFNGEEFSNEDDLYPELYNDDDVSSLAFNRGYISGANAGYGNGSDAH